MTGPTSPLERLPSARRKWSALLATLGVQPSKGMGQNFLVERGVVERIVRTAGVAPGDRVVEVGPGLGILTAHLLTAGATVDAIELDRKLAAHLRSTFAGIPALTVHEGDALVIEPDAIFPGGETYSVVANLPYSIAAAVVMRFLELPRPPLKLTVMVQKEVAERFVATPPDMTVLSVATQVLSNPRIEFAVTPGNFIPPPKVDSTVVSLIPLGARRLAFERRPLFFQLVNGGFRHKRKQVANSLEHELDLPKGDITTRLQAAGIDPLRRAQTLSVEEWLRLLDTWEQAESDR